VRMREAAVAGVTILQYAPRHPVAEAYRELATELETVVVPAPQEA
jgi:cellulose biosynthesis protein BcsQ